MAFTPFLSPKEEYFTFFELMFYILLNVLEVFWVLPGTKGKIQCDTPGILANNFKSWRNVFWVLPCTKLRIQFHAQ